MLGTDGRLYDSDFDFDEDGKLNAYEYSVMDDLVFGHEDACTSDETELEDDLLLAGLNETELECMHYMDLLMKEMVFVRLPLILIILQ